MAELGAVGKTNEVTAELQQKTAETAELQQKTEDAALQVVPHHIPEGNANGQGGGTNT